MKNAPRENRTAPTSTQLSPGWVDSWKPPSVTPAAAFYASRYGANTWESLSDLSGLGGDHDTGVQLRSVARATRTEQEKLERSFR